VNKALFHALMSVSVVFEVAVIVVGVKLWFSSRKDRSQKFFWFFWFPLLIAIGVAGTAVPVAGLIKLDHHREQACRVLPQLIHQPVLVILLTLITKVYVCRKNTEFWVDHTTTRCYKFIVGVSILISVNIIVVQYGLGATKMSSDSAGGWSCAPEQVWVEAVIYAVIAACGFFVFGKISDEAQRLSPVKISFVVVTLGGVFSTCTLFLTTTNPSLWFLLFFPPLAV